MSFSQEQKAAAILQPIKTSCCKKAMLQGMLAAKATLSDDGISLSVDGAELVEYIRNLIIEIYAQKPEILNSKKGGRRKLICFKSKSAEKYISEFDKNGDCCVEKCPTCRSSFLRGVFLAGGRVSDPEKQYSLEFNVGMRTEKFVSLFEAFGLVPKVSAKTNETLIYFRNSSMIEDFFAMANMNNTAFAFMNMKIEGEFRNTANRLSNCETNNIDRAATASARPLALLRRLKEFELLSLLPDELESTARFRLEHEDWSLARIAAEITPPISKSGLAHRMRKITEMAEKILKGRYIEP